MTPFPANSPHARLHRTGERRQQAVSSSLQEDLRAWQITGPGAGALAGRYHVREELGRGGMGYVLRTRDEWLRRDLALKVIRSSKGEPSDLQKTRFLEEAQITAQLEHPNIVPVHDLGSVAPRESLLHHEAREGDPLDAILRRRVRAIPTRSPAMDCASCWISSCPCARPSSTPRQGGRSSRPETANVMVGHYGEVLVMDWGLAKVKGRTMAVETDTSTVDEGPSSESAQPAESETEGDVTTVRSDSHAHETLAGSSWEHLPTCHRNRPRDGPTRSANDRTSTRSAPCSTRS